METQKKFITDDLEIINIFKGFIKSRKNLWAWQHIADQNGTRPVHFITIKKVDPIKKVIVVYPNNKDGFRFTRGSEIFLFCSERGFAIKTPVRELEKDFITIPLPVRLNILSKEFLEKIELVERENEDKNKHKRNAPRSQAKQGQLVCIDKLGIDNQVTRSEIFNLYDISAGGMGFMVHDPADFAVGDKVKVTHVDSKKLAKQLYGEVVAVRQVEAEALETFKIGVKFG